MQVPALSSLSLEGLNIDQDLSVPGTLTSIHTCEKGAFLADFPAVPVVTVFTCTANPGFHETLGCDIGWVGLVLTSPVLGFSSLYFLLYGWYLWKGLKQRRYQSSMELKLQDTILRIQVRYSPRSFEKPCYPIILSLCIQP